MSADDEPIRNEFKKCNRKTNSLTSKLPEWYGESALQWDIKNNRQVKETEWKKRNENVRD